MYGFVYLEEAERTMVTTEQKVQRVVIDFLEEDELVNLNSHLLRHQDMGEDTKVDVSKLICNSKESAEAISTMMQHCQSVNVQNALFVDVDIGTEGWAALRGAISGLKVGFVHCDKEAMLSARREDLKAIWDNIVDGWTVWLFSEDFEGVSGPNFEGGKGWERGEGFSKHLHDWKLVEQCLDMSNEEWNNLHPAEPSSDEEEWFSTGEDSDSIDEA